MVSESDNPHRLRRSPYLSPILRLIKSLVSLIGVVGGLSFLLNLLLGFGLLRPPIELPLYDIQQVRCMSRKVYVALGYYSRIQVYDDRGRFLEAIPVGNHSKPYSFKLDESDRPVIHLWGLGAIDEQPDGRIQGGAYVLDAACGVEEKTHIRQHLGYYLLGGPLKSALLAGFGVLVLLVFYPGFFTWMIERDRRLRLEK